MSPRRVRPGARDGGVARGRRVLLGLGVALLAVGVVLMHSTGPHVGGPGHGGSVHAAPVAHDPAQGSAHAGSLGQEPREHAVAAGGVCLAVLPGLLALVLLAVSRRVRSAATLLVRPLARARLAPARAPPRPTGLTLTRLCVLRT